MSQQEILETITSFADKAHGDQLRKYTGERYINHPIRVMETVRKYQPATEVLAAALLHDVLEDTPVSAPALEDMLSPLMDGQHVHKTLQLVIELTDIFIKKDYPRLNRGMRKEKERARLAAISADAQTIKYADIIDNVTDIVSQDADFAHVFLDEAKKMLDVMHSGHQDLREQAVALVDRCLTDLHLSRRSMQGASYGNTTSKP